jgi:sec-independent protein translocase protein TatA
MTSLFAAFFDLGPTQILILLVLGVLVFGRRLPEIGRYLGKGIVEFKKGMKGLEDEVESTVSHPAPSAPQAAIEPPRPPQRVGVTAPKFQDSASNVPSNPVTNQTPQV